jgi:hypothetical protein
MTHRVGDMELFDVNQTAHEDGATRACRRIERA